MGGWLAAAVLAVPAGFADAQQPPATAAEPAPSLIAQAMAYENGEGVPKDQLRAAQLYCTAARDGDPEAMFSLGWMYANGRGVARDDAIAASLFARAASFGHAHARQMLKFVGPDQGVVPACLLPPEPESAETTPNEPDDPFAALPPTKAKIADIVRRAAPTFGIDPQLALAIVAVESNFEPYARSAKDARGLMQLIGGTAARFNVPDRMDIAANVRGGLAYLRWLLAYYEGQVRLAVAAYNAGEAAVDKYGGVPPYRETRDYVIRVLRLFPKESHPYDPTVVEPSVAFAGGGAGTK
jgi:soluble lytic murein transglycosylase-like protein